MPNKKRIIRALRVLMGVVGLLCFVIFPPWGCGMGMGAAIAGDGAGAS